MTLQLKTEIHWPRRFTYVIRFPDQREYRAQNEESCEVLVNGKWQRLRLWRASYEPCRNPSQRPRNDRNRRCVQVARRQAFRGGECIAAPAAAGKQRP
jgi:hypothetical protein